MSGGHNYYAKQSEREYQGVVRVSKTFRLHPDRIDDLDRIARAMHISQARAIEEMITQTAIDRKLF